MLADGFTAEDFDAYLPEKWSSNMYTLPRRRVRDKLASVGGEVAGLFTGSGLQLVQHLSDDHPSLWNNKKVEAQWLFYSRDERAQRQLTEVIDTERTLAKNLADPTPLYRHVFLGVAVDREHLEIGLRLHHEAWVDRRNALALLHDEEGGGHFLDLLATLPDHYEIGVVGGSMAPVAGFDADALGRLTTAFEEAGGFLFVGARLPRDQVPVLGGEVRGVLIETMRLLIPVYRFLAWSPENDAVSLDNLLARSREAIRQAREEFAAQRQEREARRTADEAACQQRLEDVGERVRVQEQWRARERFARRIAPRDASDAAAPAASGLRPPAAPPEPSAAIPQGPPAAPTASRAERSGEQAPRRERPDAAERRSVPRPRIDRERAADIRVGDRVEVASGFLKGRLGTVQEIDDRGGLRIAFGALSSRLDRADVVGHGPAQGSRP